MAVSYRKLRELLIEQGIQRKALKSMSQLSNDTLSKIDKDEYMGLESLEKIALILNREIGDLVEIKKQS